MSNPNFKAASAVVFAALTAALLILVFACITPGLIIRELQSSVSGKLNDAIAFAVAEDYINASECADSALEEIVKRKDTLMMFFDQADVFELINAAKSASDIAKTEDAAQLLEELNGAAILIESMLRMHEASLINLF